MADGTMTKLQEALVDWMDRVVEKHQLAANSPLVADVGDDDFWKDLEVRTVEGLRNWLNNTYGKAVETFSDDLSKSGGSSQFSVVWKLTKTVLSIVPKTGLTLKAAEIALTIAKKLPKETNSLEDFLYAARTAREDIGKAIFDRDYPATKQLREMARGPQKDDPAYRSKADADMKKAIKGLPSDKLILKGLVDDWVKASNDEWDGGDGPGVDAGYVRIDVKYFQAQNKWVTKMGPYIDDLEKAGGARKALEHSYGPGTAIKKLPYPAKARVEVHMDPKSLSPAAVVTLGGALSVGYSFSKSGAGNFKDFYIEYGDVDFQGKHGFPAPEEILAQFNKYYATLRVKDLISEPGW